MRMETAMPGIIYHNLTQNHPESEVGRLTRFEVDIALLAKATELAFVSAFQYGRDFPIGAVAADANMVCGRYSAVDVRYPNYSYLHAEPMALADAKLQGGKPETVAVTLEPCGMCARDALSNSGISRVVCAIPRSVVEERGLVNERDGIFVKDGESMFPFEIALYNDPELTMLNLLLYDNMTRDISSGEISLDLEAIETGLRNSDQTTISTWFLDVPKIHGPTTPTSDPETERVDAEEDAILRRMGEIYKS